MTAHLDSFRANMVDTRATYVAISRARSHDTLCTDNHASLTEALGLRNGAQVGALDEVLGKDAGMEAIPKNNFAL